MRSSARCTTGRARIPRGAVLAEAVRSQHAAHPRWTYQLHRDDLIAWAKTQPSMGRLASYTTICRYMKAHRMIRAFGRLIAHSGAITCRTFFVP
jgi:hypothetical protein